MKPWWQSKTIITSAVAIVVAGCTALGLIPTAEAAAAEAALISLALIFLRVGDDMLTR